MGFCDFAFGFEVIPHPSCYFTSIRDKARHGSVIVLFSVKLPAAFLAYTAGVLGTNLFSQFVIDRYILAIQQIVAHEEHLQYSF